MGAEMKDFEVRCHCGECEDRAVVTVADGALSAEWWIGGEYGNTLLTFDELASAGANGVFDFEGGELNFDFGTADRLQAWAEGAVQP